MFLLLVVALILFIAIRRNRRSEKPPSEKASEMNMMPSPTSNEVDFSEVTIPYSELILKQKVGEGSENASYIQLILLKELLEQSTKGNIKEQKLPSKLFHPKK